MGTNTPLQQIVIAIRKQDWDTAEILAGLLAESAAQGDVQVVMESAWMSYRAQKHGDTQ